MFLIVYYKLLPLLIILHNKKHPFGCYLLKLSKTNTTTFCLTVLSRSNPRTVSIGHLHMLPCLQLQPIYLIVSKGSYSFRMGNLILWSASRLDAFSVYQIQTWLLCYAIGMTTDAPVVRPSRSSRTKDSSTQISCAHDG